MPGKLSICTHPKRAEVGEFTKKSCIFRKTMVRYRLCYTETFSQQNFVNARLQAGGSKERKSHEEDYLQG